MTRTYLPTRRETDAFQFELGGLSFRAAVGRFEGSGEIAEIFLDAVGRGKPDALAYVMAKDAAVVFSIARQHGVPLDAIMSALMKLNDGKAAGPLGRALQIAEALRKTPDLKLVP